MLGKKSMIAATCTGLMFSSLMIANSASATETCGGYLSNMTDPLAIRMENGEKVIWDNVDPVLIQKRDKYVSLLKQKNWTITFNSAYRPYQYQRHLYEIVQNASKSSCVAAEKAAHGLGTEVAKPSNTAPHTRGIAFDAIVKDSAGNALNGRTFVNSQLKDVAAQAGLSFPLPTTDGVHHIVAGGSTTPDDGVLRLGDQGPEVTELQQQLNKVGYTVSTDGIFGSGTDTAVKQFQSAHGLVSDGIVGVATNAKLDTLSTTTTVLRSGSSGDEVKVLQRLLTKKGYTVTADGIFGSGTDTAVKKFQTANSLTSDGIVGSATWSKLRQ
ncbi:peptidoglycan-binding protein [Paenibacillus chitinolyticus]|uniref:peptidoglycan-binding protein n=1 Tax=Paenibacillus chitinolyticus TaxID=79263 RepID=UPI001C454249|nr:peptidoglycan-binding protein [Paenibacillus chitinolyticus]MBV6712607.1 peptidoglycan-binding protein [Paenibacillus chitinolyticus]